MIESLPDALHKVIRKTTQDYLQQCFDELIDTLDNLLLENLNIEFLHEPKASGEYYALHVDEFISQHVSAYLKERADG